MVGPPVIPQKDRRPFNETQAQPWVALWPLQSCSTLDARLATGVCVMPHHVRVGRAKRSVSKVVELHHLRLALGKGNQRWINKTIGTKDNPVPRYRFLFLYIVEHLETCSSTSCKDIQNMGSQTPHSTWGWIAWNQDLEWTDQGATVNPNRLHWISTKMPQAAADSVHRNVEQIQHPLEQHMAF